ncbi:hypothetical protein [Streptomyces aureus]|uniref:hypothetical protein n=1 Tax=Streptomyces aureus TaxID=193461 RepID=UPI00131DC75F|nr:hypothetical protein [Streptomyces aureus]
MTSEAAVWHRLAALLPPEDAQEVLEFWGIGEQEGGLELLVSALLKHQVAIDETTRAEIAIVAEAWGMWPLPLGPLLSQCPGNGTASALQLIEDTARSPLPGTTVGLPDHLLLIPWISCTACGRALARAHTREPWGDLSYTPEQYVILDTDQGVALQVLTQGSGWDALMALRTSCERQP